MVVSLVMMKNMNAKNQKMTEYKELKVFVLSWLFTYSLSASTNLFITSSENGYVMCAYYLRRIRYLICFVCVSKLPYQFIHLYVCLRCPLLKWNLKHFHRREGAQVCFSPWKCCRVNGTEDDAWQNKGMISLTDLTRVVSWPPTWNVSTCFVTRLWNYKCNISRCIFHLILK